MQESFSEASLRSITPYQKKLQSGKPDTAKTTLGKSTTQEKKRPSTEKKNGEVSFFLEKNLL